MNQQYLNALTVSPKEKNVVLAKAGFNVNLEPNYFHFNKTEYRMGDDFLSLSNSKKWYPFHVAEARIIFSGIETHVGITQDELNKLENLEDSESIILEVDLLRCNQKSQVLTETLIPNGSEIEINGDIYRMKIDYNSGNFHMSNIPLGLIGERFNIEIFNTVI